MRNSDPAASTPAAQEGEGAKLDSWKEIAAYLKRDVRTVQRWESTEGLPAHRHVHLQRSSVYAFTGELDAWWSSRKQALEQAADGSPEMQVRRRVWPYAAIVALLGGVAVAWAILRVRPADRPLTVRPLTAERGLEIQPAFSPDGSKIAYRWEKDGEDYPDIYVKSLSSGDALQITKTPTVEEGSPVWSPDGNWIAFFRFGKPTWMILVAPALGGAERRITTVGVYQSLVPAYLLTWAPDGKTLIFPDRNGAGDDLALHAVSVADGERWRLTEPPPGSYDSSPSVSADGAQLAFVRTAALGAAHRLYLAPLSASGHLAGSATPFAQEDDSVTEVNWVGNERLAYLCSVDSRRTGGVWTVRVDGHDRPRLVFPLYTLASGATTRLSPDGHRLAYASYAPRFGFARTELPSDPTREVPVRTIPSAVAGNGGPDFSPDGDSFTYRSTRSGHPEIWTSRADGSKPIQITRTDGTATWSPRWSPDGTKIVFAWSPSFNEDIWFVNSDGGTPVRLTTEPSSEIYPSWSRDGKWIYFSSNRTGRHEIWKAPSAGGSAVQITRRGGVLGFESPDGKFFYYGSEYRWPELRRVPVEGGDEVTLFPRFFFAYNLAIGQTGVYFLPVCSECYRQKRPWELHRYRFSDGKMEVVSRFRVQPGGGFTVAPDEHSVLLTVIEKSTTNIMLVDGLR